MYNNGYAGNGYATHFLQLEKKSPMANHHRGEETMNQEENLPPVMLVENEGDKGNYLLANTEGTNLKNVLRSTSPEYLNSLPAVILVDDGNSEPYYLVRDEEEPFAVIQEDEVTYSFFIVIFFFVRYFKQKN